VRGLAVKWTVQFYRDSHCCRTYGLLLSAEATARRLLPRTMDWHSLQVARGLSPNKRQANQLGSVSATNDSPRIFRTVQSCICMSLLALLVKIAHLRPAIVGGVTARSDLCPIRVQWLQAVLMRLLAF